MFFFILSGFVLGKSLEREGQLSWSAISGYWIRRFFRLYPVVLFAVLFAAGSAFFYSTSEQWAEVAAWPKGMMELSRNLSGLREYISCLVLHVSYLNAPLWTIKVEMICSVLLPFIVLAVHRSPRKLLTLGVLVIFFAFYYGNTPQGIISTKYMLHFVLGFTAWRLSAWFGQIGPRGSSLGMGVLLLGLFAANYWSFGGLIQAGVLFLLFGLLVPCRLPQLKKLLLAPTLQFLGRISFSFYVLHWPVMLLLLSFMQETLSPDFPTASLFSQGLLLFLTSSIATLMLAALTERWIEKPANLMGHRLSEVWLNRSVTSRRRLQ